MAGGLGVLGYVGLGKESSGGVAVSPQVYIQGLSEGISGDFDRYDLYNITGRLAPPDDRAGIMRIAGDFTAPVDPWSHGHVFNNAFGQEQTVSSLGSSKWLHTWKSPTASQFDVKYALPPYTWEVFRDVGSAQQYDGGQVSGLEFSLAPNGVLTTKASVIATAWRNIAVSVPSFSILPPFDTKVASLSLGGAATQLIENLTFTWNNNLEGIPTINGRDVIQKIRRTDAPSLDLSFTIGFEDIATLEQFRQQSETSMRLTMQQPGGTEIFDLQLPRIVFTKYPTGMGGRGRQTIDVSAMARYHQGSGTAFLLSLTNGVGSY